MDRRGIAAVLISAFLVVSPVVAQIAQPSANATARDGAPTEDGMKSWVRADRNSGATADARLCLEFPTNLEIIMCAEKYRPKRRST